MNGIVPTLSSEVQFVTFADSSKGGPRITLRLPERELVDAFIGKEGKRYMAVLVEIGDQEQPVPPAPPAAKKTAKPKDGPDHALSKWAALSCADPEFWRWIEAMTGLACGAIDGEQDAAQWMRLRCGVKSRAEFDTDPAAAQRLKERVIGKWHKHCIARGITS